ncbi:MAG TPA: PEP-CTERM sorting domain-containing protein [Phycisphaerae bacterium]|nr:PEP-CTERM sorting domain-containing protein [Phycisphaerae bacterium]HRY70666.1 PEP-CTERM sorting domain-containing protein [Phycisphaerae bacterium]HSA28739.1 PEP-CTERM sorting domain-containing protein [Phycisphaerae bacterium]
MSAIRHWFCFGMGALGVATGLAVSQVGAATQDLLVSTGAGRSVLRYDGTTGAYLGTLVSAGSGGLQRADGMTFGPDGNLYVGSYDPNLAVADSVKRYNGQTGAYIAPDASGGDLFCPWGVRFGPDGNLYASSSYRSWVNRYDGTTGAFIDYFIPDHSGGLEGPNGILFHGDYLYVAAGGFTTPIDKVLRYSATTGAFDKVFVDFQSGGLSVPANMTFGPDGNFYVTGWGSNAVHRYNGATGAFIDLFVPPGTLNGPIGLTFGPDGNLYVASWRGNRIQRYNGTTGAFLNTFATVSSPFEIVFTPEPATLALLGAGVLAAARRRRSALTGR